LLIHCVPEPTVIGCRGVGSHESVVDDIIASIDLAMSRALIVIPNASAPSREHRLDAQQVCHLPRLENPALRVDQWNAFTAELEAAREISRTKNTASNIGEPVDVIERCLPQTGIVSGQVHRRNLHAI
jgi:hypothetical protein